MALREILKMCDPRLWRVAQPVAALKTRELDALVTDLFDTMEAANVAGLAAPQIGVDLAVVIFGFEHSARYPDAAAWCHGPRTFDKAASIRAASRSSTRRPNFTRGWFSTSAITCSVCCAGRACAISGVLTTPKWCSLIWQTVVMTDRPACKV